MSKDSVRVHQLQEFVAHLSKVNCLKIGRKSGRVLVTGGDDKNVNMWAIGKPTNIMSLSGHTSPVECVSFDTAEEIVVAGSSGGTLKLWDLDQQKVVRTLPGHKSNVISVDFYPFGGFFASGSTDTQLKIWDIRKKGCIQTYQGHTKAINYIKFSPDGRWVMSGGDDGIVKLWDLTAGKALHEFKEHNGPITSIEFHPNEFFLATGSADKTIKFWDLETFESVSTTDLESSRVKSLTFTPDGSCLLSAHSDSLKVWGWEPARCLDSVHVNWRDVADLNITADQLIAASIVQSSVIIWVISLQKLRPYIKDQPVFDPPIDMKSSLDMNRTSDAMNQLQIQSKSPVKNKQDQIVNKRGSERKENRGIEEKNLDFYPVKESMQTATKTQEREKNSTNLDLQTFLPKTRTNTLESDDPTEVIEELLKPHSPLCNILALRHTNLKVVRSIWAKGEVREAIDTMARMNDPAVIVDILNTIVDKQNIFNLDICVTLLPILNDLLSGSYDDYVITSLKTTKQLLSSFGPIIKSTLSAPPISGVDLVAEERMEKCNYCKTGFLQIQKKLGKLTHRPGELGQYAREVDIALKTFV